MARILSFQSKDSISLKLNKTERKILLDLMILDQVTTETLLNVPVNQSIAFSVAELDHVAGFLAAEANHAKNETIQGRLDRLYERIDFALAQYARWQQPHTAIGQSEHSQDAINLPDK